MHRIEGAYYDASGGTNLFQDSSSIGTRLTAAWFNAVQEELCNLLIGLGGTPTTAGADTARNQLYSIMETAGIAKPAVTRYDAMTSDVTFTCPYGANKIIIAEPTGATRYIVPSGTFTDGFLLTIMNISTTQIIVFGSGANIFNLIALDSYRYVYDSVNYSWREIHYT